MDNGNKFYECWSKRFNDEERSLNISLRNVVGPMTAILFVDCRCATSEAARYLRASTTYFYLFTEEYDEWSLQTLEVRLYLFWTTCAMGNQPSNRPNATEQGNTWYSYQQQVNSLYTHQVFGYISCSLLLSQNYRNDTGLRVGVT